ncbi:MAG: hypothetical protein JXR51_08205 [Bacteroidales bacterium]|nr:hypothetical protein [Bacteroidales bacterium]
MFGILLGAFFGELPEQEKYRLERELEKQENRYIKKKLDYMGIAKTLDRLKDELKPMLVEKLRENNLKIMKHEITFEEHQAKEAELSKIEDQISSVKKECETEMRRLRKEIETLNKEYDKSYNEYRRFGMKHGIYSKDLKEKMWSDWDFHEMSEPKLYNYEPQVLRYKNKNKK